MKEYNPCPNTAAHNAFHANQDQMDIAHDSALKAQERSGIDPIEEQTKALLENRGELGDAIAELSNGEALIDLFVVMMNDGDEGNEAVKLGRQLLTDVLTQKAKEYVEAEGGLFLDNLVHDTDYQESLFNLECQKMEFRLINTMSIGFWQYGPMELSTKLRFVRVNANGTYRFTRVSSDPATNGTICELRRKEILNLQRINPFPKPEVTNND